MVCHCVLYGVLPVVWCVTCGVVCYLWCGVLPVVCYLKCVTCGVLPVVCYLWCVTCGVSWCVSGVHSGRSSSFTRGLVRSGAMSVSVSVGNDMVTQ